MQYCIKHRHPLAWRTGLVGLALTGDINANAQLSVGVINELSTDSVMVRVDDWSVHRDARFELATLSMGGHRNKSDIRSTLKGSNASLKQFIAFTDMGRDMMIINRNPSPTTAYEFTLVAQRCLR